MDVEEAEVAIIGGGPAGYVAAIRAAQLGGQVILIEKDRLGGVCLNVGCIPTKVLARSCEIFTLVEKAGEFGLETGEAKIDLSKLMKRKKRVVNRLVGGVNYLLKKNNVKWIKGEGKILDPSTISVESESGNYQVKSKNIIIATGSSPSMLPLEGVDKDSVLTSTEALEIDVPPENLLIVGGGVIGVEFAFIYATLGSKVTVVEMLPRVLPGEDGELTEKLKEIMLRKQITVYTGSVLKDAKKEGKGYKGLIKTPEGEKEVYFDKVLISIGRKPNSQEVGLERVGIEMDSRGWIKVNSQMKTNIPGIYAAGDVVGGYCLAHVAYMEGEVAAENVMGKPSQVNYRAVPRFVCSNPEMAAVGLTEEKAREKGYKVKVGKFPFSANGKALILGETDGLVKIICDSETEEILGIHILGPQATDLILEGTLAINLENTVEEVIETIHPHPTLGEAIREAALDAQRRAIHF